MTTVNLPAAGERRFWLIKHDPKSRTKPVRVELRETVVEGRKVESMSKLLGYDNTVADGDEVFKTATEIEARVGRIDEFVGVH